MYPSGILLSSPKLDYSTTTPHSAAQRGMHDKIFRFGFLSLYLHSANESRYEATAIRKYCHRATLCTATLRCGNAEPSDSPPRRHPAHDTHHHNGDNRGTAQPYPCRHHGYPHAGSHIHGLYHRLVAMASAEPNHPKRHMGTRYLDIHHHLGTWHSNQRAHAPLKASASAKQKLVNVGPKYRRSGSIDSRHAPCIFCHI